MKMTEAKNTLNKPKEQKNKKSSQPKRRFKKIIQFNQNVSIGKSLAGILDGSFLTRNDLLKQIPFILFITFLGIFYIANSYNAEKTIIEISKTKKQLEELRYEYITTKSNLMFLSKQSEVAYRLASHEVKESIVPPVKLTVNSDKE